jgi:hypothetical protein
MTGTAPALLGALTEELTRAGWTRHREPAPAARPRALIEGCAFTDPTGSVQVHACAYLTRGEVETRLWGVDPHRPDAPHPRWWAGTGALAPAVILAAAHAATAPDPKPPRDVQARLRAAGWHLADARHEGPRLIEEQWISPDRSRSASWFPPDPPWDTGGWLITRPDRLRPAAEIDTTNAPCAVTAALALTD